MATVQEPPKALEKLESREYEHPFDQRALNTLEGTPGLETLIRKLNEHGLERLMRVQYTGSNLKITERNFPELHGALKRACETLSLKSLPDLYVSHSGGINAFTAGVEKPIIVLTTSCVDSLTLDELSFVIAHEVGHIKSNHVLYYQLASILPGLGGFIGSLTLGIGKLISGGLELALLNWQRMSELTADRAGLLACQRIDVVTSTMLKLAGMPKKYAGLTVSEEFLQQAREFEAFDHSGLDKITKFLSILGSDHPWTVMRTAELLKWIDSGSYQRVLDRETLATASGPPALAVRFCSQCGNRVEANAKFCGRCGKNLG